MVKERKIKFEIVEFSINLFYNFFLGLKRFKSDLKLMLGKSPNFYWIICFKILTPIFTIVIFLITIKREHFLKRDVFIPLEMACRLCF
jgi:hypothetical protein